MKKDVREVIGEEPHLNNLLTQEDLSSNLKGAPGVSTDTSKKQMFRTETEAIYLCYRIIDTQPKLQSIGSV